MLQATRQGLGDPGNLVQMLYKPFPGFLGLSTGIWVRLRPDDVSSYPRLNSWNNSGGWGNRAQGLTWELIQGQRPLCHLNKYWEQSLLHDIHSSHLVLGNLLFEPRMASWLELATRVSLTRCCVKVWQSSQQLTTHRRDTKGHLMPVSCPREDSPKGPTIGPSQARLN